jgi:pyruvate dehydrogenase (quinone)
MIEQALGESSHVRYRSTTLHAAVHGLLAALVGWRGIATHLRRSQDDRSRTEVESILPSIPPELRPTWKTSSRERWMADHVDTRGKRRTFGSLLHGTMASGMPSAIGLQKSAPGRQVICMAGDGGFTMLLGDLLTVVQENVPIKIVVFDNGKLGFIDIEQKSAGIEPIFTDLKNPDFGKVAEAMGLWGRCVTKAGDLQGAIVDWLAQPGPALLDVKVNPMQLVMPPSRFVRPEAVVGMAVYTAKAMLHGKGHDVWEMVVENIP